MLLTNFENIKDIFLGRNNETDVAFDKDNYLMESVSIKNIIKLTSLYIIIFGSIER